VTVDFGYVVTLGADSAEGGRSLVDDNRRLLSALRQPFNTLWLEDHFQFGDNPLLECWTALCTYGAEFKHLRLGTIVMAQSYRNPAALAKMAAVLQWMSGGRLIYGIGAGWKEDEYRAYNYPFPKPAVRIAQLEEAILIAKKLWTETPATFTGKHYSITNANCTPRPDPVPPIMVGGGGEQLTLRVVAKHADWWNLGFSPIERYRQKLAVLRDHCAKVGRDPSTLTLTYYAMLNVVRDASQYQPRDRPYAVGGTPDQVAAELQQFIDLGVRHVLLRLADFPSLEGLTIFQDEVIPRLKLGN
jgi:alkanesulfonate monooxygenase SsuD/methylene tetrahydromethanopterin reductase-like flavin-dependent oxidoreductase (luciferase family)